MVDIMAEGYGDDQISPLSLVDSTHVISHFVGNNVGKDMEEWLRAR